MIRVEFECCKNLSSCHVLLTLDAKEPFQNLPKAQLPCFNNSAQLVRRAGMFHSRETAHNPVLSRMLRDRMPQSRIAFLCNPWCCELSPGTPLCNEAISTSSRRHATCHAQSDIQTDFDLYGPPLDRH